MVGHVVGFYNFTDCIYTDVVGVFFAITSAHHSHHFLLLFFLSKENFFHLRYQRQCAVGRFRLHNVHTDNAFIVLYHLVTDADRLVFKVHRRPFQSKHFATPKPIVSCKEDYNVYRVIHRFVEQFFQLGGVIILADILLRLRSVGLLNGVARYHPALDRRLESKMQQCVMALSSCAFESVIADANIVIVDFITRNVLDLEVTAGTEERNHS